MLMNAWMFLLQSIMKIWMTNLQVLWRIMNKWMAILQVLLIFKVNKMSRSIDTTLVNAGIT
jgi:hypothetical protein